MSIIYSIRNWGKNFENHRTRELQKMEFVLLPNSMDGDGYTELLDHEDGAAHFGAWCALVQVASKCSPRGTLIRSTGKPHTPESLERITRIPARVFRAVFPRLVENGWVETCAEKRDALCAEKRDALCAEKRDAYAGARALERNGMERNGIHAAPQADAAASDADPAAIEPEVMRSVPSETGWPEFEEAITEAGMPCSEPDRKAMRQKWRKLSVEDRRAAIEHVREALDAGMYSDPRYVPNARAFLIEQRWERGVRKRAGPGAGVDSKTARAFQIFVAGG